MYKVRCKGIEEGAKAEEFQVESPDDPDVASCKFVLEVITFNSSNTFPVH